MALRFRKSVRLMPGVRVNFSKSGPSLSVGGRGATVNFSARGTRTTVGLPGTGLSWSTTSSRGRAPSRRQIEAVIRRAELEARVRAAEEFVEEQEQVLRDIVDSWRDFPTIPSRETFVAATAERPFTSNEAPPAPPVEMEAARSLRNELRLAARRELGRHPARFLLLLPLGLAAATYTFSTEVAMWLAWGGVPAVGAGLYLARAIASRRRASVHFAASWPARWAELQGDHAARLHTFQVQQEEARARWVESERQRIERLQRLLAGDPHAIEEVVADALGEIDFPFETSCGVEVADSSTVMLAVDLPEIEDVIPETGHRVLKDGTIKEVKRTRADRNGAYAQLACGLALQLACCALAAAPTLQQVHVAAYTQRRQRGSGVLADEWVYELEIDRALIQRIDPATADPIEIARSVPGRIDLRSTMELARIAPPAWAPRATAEERRTS